MASKSAGSLEKLPASKDLDHLKLLYCGFASGLVQAGEFSVHDIFISTFWFRNLLNFEITFSEINEVLLLKQSWFFFTASIASRRMSA